MEDEFDEIEQRNGWQMAFMKIKITAGQYDYSIQDAKKAENRPRNRYRDVSPYDHTRVKLKRADNDYINACLVKSPEANRSYILTQGPLPSTSGHFWLMVWEQRSKAVVMLNNVIEKGTIKCAQYWPLGEENGGDDIITFEEEQIRIALLDEDVRSYYTLRTLQIEDMVSGNTRDIFHFHYTTWPDFGLPDSPAAFLNFLSAVRDSGSLSADVGPPVLHCSAGIGRSGMFCMVDACLVMVEKNQDMDNIEVQNILLEMRRYRMGLIQTPDQLRFTYLAIIAGAKTILKHGRLELPTCENNVGVSANSNNDSEPEAPPPPIPPKKSRSQEFRDKASKETVSPVNVKAEKPIVNTETDDIAKREHEIRKRKREEKRHSMEERLSKMRKKQHDSEIWKKQRSLLQYIGIGVVVVTGVFLLYKYYF
ncbi:tyrosine-protein phosphatase non-receptor type 1-like [Saccoglossus kowalevskii]|uniref:protein-tyrosine-phosphatase n=1 Tax=Saccoglossus kowalevskii TaxID=10224 RepID=A0ABM0H0Q4_SACKO|nr:PREDICTED: tyrosine-protein phosphatase non-receptor type 1-like [Saccoglossus kowalevskii]